jgi:polar amino acid transport system permease protein
VIDLRLIAEQMPYILWGVPLTFGILIGAFGLGTAVAIPLAFTVHLRLAFLAPMARMWVRFFLATPPIVHVFWIYYALPIATGIRFSAITSVIVGLAVGASAMMTEAIRAGFAAVPPAQQRAAIVLGLTPYQRYRHVIVPQMLRHLFAPTVNALVILIKETSLASILAVPELLNRGLIVSGNTFRQLEALTFVAIVYFVVTWPVTLLAASLEKRTRTAFRR